jgi:putative sigma-54 modulation protein
MHLLFTFRNLETSDTLKEYASEKLERINKYFPDPIKVHIVFSQQRNYVHVVDVQITLHNGLVVKGQEATEDFHSSVDLVMAKIERQLRRYKDRIRDHKPASGPERAMMHRVVSMETPVPLPDTGADKGSEKAVPTHTQAPASRPAPPSRPDFQVIREEKFVAVPMSVEDAIMRMNLRHEQFLVFNNAVTHEINVVYRRDDETYGLVETTHDTGSTESRAQSS